MVHVKPQEDIIGNMPNKLTLGSLFDGAGTIPFAAKLCGIEKEEKYFEIAKKRIKEVEDATKLW